MPPKKLWRGWEFDMPLTQKGTNILKKMQETYGAEKGKQVFYASQNKGTITGTHKVLARRARVLRRRRKK